MKLLAAYRKSVFALLLLWLWTSAAAAAIPDTLEINHVQSNLISSYPGYYIDAKGTLTLEKALRMQFPRHTKETPSFGWSDNVVWIKSSFRKMDQDEYAVEIGYPLLDDVNIWLYRDGKLVHTLRAGDSVVNSREIVDRVDPAFYLPREAGDYQLVLRIKSSSSIQAPLYLHALNHFHDKEKDEFFATGMYAGILGIMALYNMFVFMSTRHRSYVLYSGFVVTFLLLQLSLSGHTYQYLWTSMPQLSDYMICQGGVVATLFMVLFANDFLQIARYGGKRAKTMSLL
jgi:hypothetical protein